MTKEIEWFCFEVYFPDYMASFRPLTAQIAYEFGFSSGEMSGYDRGYNTGYSTGYTNGHTDGYNEGSIDTQYGVNTVVNFNQLVHGFSSINGLNRTYDSETGKLNVDGTITSETAGTKYFTFGTGQFIEGHKYLFLNLYSIFGKNIGCLLNESPYNNIFTNITNDFSFKTSAYTTNNYIFYVVLNDGDVINSETYPQIFDLTQIYGVGNEPTNIDTFKNDFPSNYYPYAVSDLININYENGYIKGEKEGYATGYEKGKDAQATQQLTSTGWISSIFGGISSLLNIQIFPGVTIGIIVGIPFIISLAYFVIRAFRGGGGA